MESSRPEILVSWQLFLLASGGNTVVEQFPHHLKFKGSNPSAAGIEKKKIVKKCCFSLRENCYVYDIILFPNRILGNYHTGDEFKAKQLFVLASSIGSVAE